MTTNDGIGGLSPLPTKGEMQVEKEKTWKTLDEHIRSSLYGKLDAEIGCSVEVDDLRSNIATNLAGG